MPIFDFECPNCKKIFMDIIVNINDDDVIECDECGTICKKLIGYTNFIMTGHSYKNGYSEQPCLSKLGFDEYERKVNGKNFDGASIKTRKR